MWTARWAWLAMWLIQTYIALEFLLALELLHGQLKYYWWENKSVEISQVPFRWMLYCPFLLIQIGKSWYGRRQTQRGRGWLSWRPWWRHTFLDSCSPMNWALDSCFLSLPPFLTSPPSQPLPFLSHLCSFLFHSSFLPPSSHQWDWSDLLNNSYQEEMVWCR